MSDTDGENLFESAWLRCRVAASFKPDEAFVRVLNAFAAEPPEFYVSSSLVSPSPPQIDEQDGQVRVTLLHRHNGRSLVEVSGEPITFGPRFEVPTDLLT